MDRKSGASENKPRIFCCKRKTASSISEYRWSLPENNKCCALSFALSVKRVRQLSCSREAYAAFLRYSAPLSTAFQFASRISSGLSLWK